MVTAKTKAKGKSSWKGKLPKETTVEVPHTEVTQEPSTPEVSSRSESKVMWNSEERHKVAICVAIYILGHFDAPRYEALGQGYLLALTFQLLPADRQRPVKSVESDFRLYQDALVMLSRYTRPVKDALESALHHPDFLVTDPYKPVIQAEPPQPIVLERQVNVELSIDEMLDRIPVMELIRFSKNREIEILEMVQQSHPRMNLAQQSRSVNLKKIIAVGFSEQTRSHSAEAIRNALVEIKYIEYRPGTKIPLPEGCTVLLTGNSKDWKGPLEAQGIRVEVVEDNARDLINKVWAIHSRQ